MKRSVAGILCAALALALPLAAHAVDSTPQGRLETAAGVYAFNATTCAIHTEDGMLDILIQGAGTTPDGDIFYLELQSMGGSLDIELGVDGPFQSLDRQIRAGEYVSAAFTIDATGGMITIPDLMLVDQDGQLVDARAQLWIDCNAQGPDVSPSP
ncbi:MAG: hypothetical protein WDA25_04690 [Paracoccaceae bacterium]